MICVNFGREPSMAFVAVLLYLISIATLVSGGRLDCDKAPQPELKTICEKLYQMDAIARVRRLKFECERNMMIVVR